LDIGREPAEGELPPWGFTVPGISLLEETMNNPKPDEPRRPLQSLKVAPPWRMLLVGKGVEIIITGDSAALVDSAATSVFEYLKDYLTVVELPKGATFEDLQAIKSKVLA
jgi:hypothetical protein